MNPAKTTKVLLNEIKKTRYTPKPSMFRLPVFHIQIPLTGFLSIMTNYITINHQLIVPGRPTSGAQKYDG